ncbi:MAG: HTH domain-containing protein [Pseudomonadota bacterium]
MRAARLLQILLLLQNRGRQTSMQLAEELEVAPRTILRDVDAMTEAGLPIIAHQGQGGGIELGFNYRTRLTGLARDEAAALGLILAAESPMIAALGVEQEATRARAKLLESLPDRTRQEAQATMQRFSVSRQSSLDDARIRAMALAVRAGTLVRVRFATPDEQVIHPAALTLDEGGWAVQDALSGGVIPLEAWGRLNISAKRFSQEDR